MEKNEILKKSQDMIKYQLENIDDICDYNQKKVLSAFITNKVSATDFSYVSGYGHDDVGREKLDSVFASVFNSEMALVRNNFVSGTHAIACAILGNLKPNDTLISLTGSPYDTLEEVIGKRGKNPSSAISMGVNYFEIELVNNEEIDYEAIYNKVDSKTNLVMIQRSCGYSLRKSLSTLEIKKIIEIVKSKNKSCICFVDNCYGEFVETQEPTDVGADIIAGSLIKNPGGGIVETGGYICGKARYVKNAASRLTAPGIGEYGGSMLNQTRLILQGLFMAPNIVAGALKSAVLASCVFENIGYKSYPKPQDNRSDIIQKIVFNDKDALIKFCQIVQKYSPIDSYITPIEDTVPGYDNKLIMAGGTFIEGSTIELSCDGPLRSPYVAYLQGALSFSHMKIVLNEIINEIKKSEIICQEIAKK